MKRAKNGGCLENRVLNDRAVKSGAAPIFVKDILKYAADPPARLGSFGQILKPGEQDEYAQVNSEQGDYFA